ncbi:hypothetical protein PFISCL1PPCAC_9360, partial [Pristionchus fissidentatus]
FRMVSTKAIVIFFLLAFVATSAMAQVRVSACDEVCGRIDREKTSCCRAHHYRDWYTCFGGRMYCV